MSDYIRCKACGYVTTQGTAGNVCPACGVPSKMFESFTQTMSESRRRILDLHTHPVMVHFPQAFTLTLFALSLFYFFAPSGLKPALLSTVQVLSILLPCGVIGSVATGLLDGNLRFRKVTTPLLKKKILLSLIFFVLSTALAMLAVQGRVETFPSHMMYTALAACASLCGALLGLIGGRLLNAKFPG
ncbi:MAG: hypothetical protein CVU54_12800 [Deltaproteobacteria bacterium HGW-Deltaproteobacteria-12]|nr:MAG: hypothetical protein CVU54_12800 [Deltaproteobacteria bacterium HGW-Deltaproteobacteria-12]